MVYEGREGVSQEFLLKAQKHTSNPLIARLAAFLYAVRNIHSQRMSVYMHFFPYLPESDEAFSPTYSDHWFACNTNSSFFKCQNAVSFTNSTYVEWHHQKLSSSVEETMNSLFAVYEVSSYDIYDVIVEFQAALITHALPRCHLQEMRSTAIYIPTPLQVMTDIFG